MYPIKPAKATIANETAAPEMIPANRVRPPDR
jgi:hypothetical protein